MLMYMYIHIRIYIQVYVNGGLIQSSTAVPLAGTNNKGGLHT